MPQVSNLRLKTLLDRVAAGRLICPYCQDALSARLLAADRLQLHCPGCGFTEAPDVMDEERAS